jgi:hypothetical protein
MQGTIDGVTMFSAIRDTALGAAALGLCAGVAGPAQAAYVVSLEQAGANVVASGSGTLDLASLSSRGVDASFSGVTPSVGDIDTGQSPANTPVYGGFTGPTSFGSRSSTTFSSSDTGDHVGIEGATHQLFVPPGYVSGNPLLDTSTYAGATFASLGVTPGTYVWTWGTGANADSFTLQIGPAAAPEPASLSVLALGLAGLGVVLRTRRG